MITEPGIVDGLDELEYHADPVPETSLSVSGAKKLLDCPARFKHEQANRTVKKAFDFGHAAHGKVLGVGAPLIEIEADDWRTKAAREAASEARAAGSVPLLTKEIKTVDAMAAKLLEHPVAATLMRAGKAETSMFHRDPDTKVMLRARLDWLTTWHDGRPVIVDYKTTARTANPDRFGWEARDFDYHMQDSWYRELATALTGEDHLFLFIVQEKAAPHLVSVCELDDISRTAGHRRNVTARRLYLDCMTTDQWPAYSPVIHSVSVPGAAYTPDPQGDPA